MKILFYRAKIFISVLLALFVLIVPATLVSAQLRSPQGRLELSDQLIPLLAREQAYPLSQNIPTLNLSISLRLQNEAVLDALLAAQNDKRSPLFHRYLTPQEFTRRFASDKASVQALVKYLQNQGLRVSSIAPNRLLLNASGSRIAIEKAFAVHIASYRLGQRLVYAPSNPPSLPGSLAKIVLHIGGLDNVVQYHPYYRFQHAGTTPVAGAFTPDRLRKAYGVEPLLKRGFDGSGEKIAFVELDGFNPADIAQYYAKYQLGIPNYTTILLDGATTTPLGSAVEVELDMQVAAAIAPKAQQMLYIGQNTLDGLNNLYTRIVNDNQAKVVSISWGVCEAGFPLAEHQALDTIFKQGAAQGIAFFAAAGDSGAYDCQSYALAVDSPADNPYVVGVGGTHLETTSDGEHTREKTWSCAECVQGGPHGTGGGGGISTIFPRPDYQTRSGLNNLYRAVPDVAALADPRAGYAIYCTVVISSCAATGWNMLGGTSASAPLWAALAVELNQYLTSQHKPTLGNALPLLYGLYAKKTAKLSPFRDITEGNNLYYSATAGYDLTTGLGTPNAFDLARALAEEVSDSS